MCVFLFFFFFFFFFFFVLSYIFVLLEMLLFEELSDSLWLIGLGFCLIIEGAWFEEVYINGCVVLSFFFFFFFFFYNFQMCHFLG